MLLVGAAQILFLRVPAYAAVATSVELLVRGPGRAWRGLVNAVLRKIAERGGAIVERQDAGRANTPDWMWRSWSGAYGDAEASRIAEAHLAEPQLDIAPKAEPETWATKLGGQVVLERCVRLPLSGPVESLAGFRDGEWWVQDVAAQLPVRLFGTVDGLRVADLCAAPGGKTMQLAAMGARVTAVDVSETRVHRLMANLARTRLTADVVTADAATWASESLFDAVLVDAPCTATGTIRRRPDLLWQRVPDEIRALNALQDALLDNAFRLVRPGGLVVYAVCSLERDECESRVAALCRRNPAAEPLPLEAAADALPAEYVTEAGHLRTLPSQLPEIGGLDGFFAARLRRRDGVV